MSHVRSVAVAILLAVLGALVCGAGSVYAARPIILSSTSTSTQLTINGRDFAPGVASVLLGATGPLTVESQTDSQLVVRLPGGLAAGDYVLSVQIGRAGHRDDDG